MKKKKCLSCKKYFNANKAKCPYCGSGLFDYKDSNGGTVCYFGLDLLNYVYKCDYPEAEHAEMILLSKADVSRLINENILDSEYSNQNIYMSVDEKNNDQILGYLYIPSIVTCGFYTI